jgi:LmeA-like phospholipid-binding
METDLDPTSDRRRRGSGCLIKSLVGVLSILLLASLAVWFLGDRVARPRIEQKVARELLREYSLPSMPTVNIEGSPFLVKAAAGSIDRVTVRMGRFTTEGFTVNSANVVADGLTFTASEAMRGTGPIVAATAKATVRITTSDLSAYLQARGIPLTITATGDTTMVSGQVSAFGVTVSGSATGEMVLVGNNLKFAPTDVTVEGVSAKVGAEVAKAALAFSVPIPRVAGMTITSARIVGGQLVCEAVAENYVLNRKR